MEIKKYKERNTKDYLIYDVFSVLLIAIIFALSILTTNSTINSLMKFLNYKYDVVFEIEDTEDALDDSYVKLNSKFLIANQNNSEMVNVYIQRNVNYSHLSPIDSENLSSDEIIINKTLAKRLNVKLGESIEIKFDNEIKIYKVEEISNAGNNFYDPEQEGYYDVVINDQLILENYNHMIILYTSSENKETIYQDYKFNINNITLRSDSVKKLFNKSLVIIPFIVITLIVEIILCNLFFAFKTKDYLLYHSDNYPLSMIRKIYHADILMVQVLPKVFLMLTLALLVLIEVNFIHLIIYLIVSIIILIYIKLRFEKLWKQKI